MSKVLQLFFPNSGTHQLGHTYFEVLFPDGADLVSAKATHGQKRPHEFQGSKCLVFVVRCEKTTQILAEELSPRFFPSCPLRVS